MWRVVMEGAATLTEVETTWSLDDLMRANAVLDMKADYEQDAMNDRSRANH